MFKRKTFCGVRETILVVLLVCVFYFDFYFDYFKSFRNKLSGVVVSIQYLINLPINILQNVSSHFISKKKLIDENFLLNSQIMLVNVNLQRLKFLERENHELRSMLNYSKNFNKKKVLFSKIVISATDKFVNQFIIDKGQNDGVDIGQPVLDVYGLCGRVVLVKPGLSKVMAITDKKSAVPVMITRNGFQAIAVGSGEENSLELINITETNDVKEGDILVTSGLGSFYSSGYRVGIIRKIEKIFGERFVRVVIEPTAHINKSLYVFLIRSDV